MTGKKRPGYTPRSEHVRLRLRTDERLAFELAAASRGVTLSDWIRKACENESRYQQSSATEESHVSE